VPDRVFRRLHIADLPLVLQMNQDFDDMWRLREENVRLFLSQPHNWLYACIEGGHILGYACGYELNRLDDAGNMLYTHGVGVLPEYHRQGIGRRMLSDIKTMCRLSGICRFFLFTHHSNQAACGLYRALGGETDWKGDDDVSFFFNNLEDC